jgi:hypothetical protein
VRTANELVTDLTSRVNEAAGEPAAREAYREGFRRLRSTLDMYPVSGRSASVIFESASRTASTLAADCLPLGVAVAMHLYPLCVLQCIPVPLVSIARLQRVMLLRTIRKRALILANAGSDRSRGAHEPVIARQDADGIRIDGTFDYMSLASVADVVFFKAQLADNGGTALCAADLRAGSVRIGGWKFSGRMRLSDTSSVTFAAHLVPHGRYVLVTDDDVLSCTSDYQRCWFHLFLADLYLARLERLQQAGGFVRSTEHIVNLTELAQLRAYALRLLDEFSSGADIQPLKKITSAIKLRVSLMAQASMTLLRGPDAIELGYIKSQPTADDVILRSIGALTV